MKFRVLGPIEVEVAGELMSLPGRRTRCLLGVLLLHPGRVVPVDRLAELLWDGDPPEQARRVIHSHVSRLRAALTGTRGDDHRDDDGTELVTFGDGYRLDTDPEAVDANEFRRLLTQAALTAEPDARTRLLREALGLWRGPALANAATGWLRDRLCADLDERRLNAVEDLMTASLALRREREILPELAQLALTHPDREELTALHMRALYQAARRVDALDVYARTRARLAEELGLDPGPRLRELHHAILSDRLAVPEPPPAASRRPQSASTGGAATRRLRVEPPASRHPPADTTDPSGRARALAEALRAHRRRLVMTQEELAEETGMSVRSIQKLEAGRVTSPRPASVRLLADAFGLTGTDRDSFIRTAAAGPDDQPRRRLKPAQLPADTTVFTGRAEQLACLDTLLGVPAAESAPVTVAAITGTAGVGKTALAVRCAHRARSRFPDGQLYVNLRGYDPDQPMNPNDTLARFLTALGVRGQDIPVDLDDRAARYRTEVTDARMLIVLDNASSVEQVRPLLPGSGSCAVVVTSRDSLAGLVAVDGAHRLDLDLLPPADAASLLRRLIGPQVDAEPDAASTLADQCARLPLALRVAAELAVSRPTTTLAELVVELTDQQRRLDLLEGGGDPHAAVRAVFSWSLRQLPSDAARTFRLLGLHPGPDFDAYATAAIIGADLQPARRALDLLIRAHLVHPTGSGRYGMHDLLRAYAAQLANADDPREQRRAALDRLFDYHLATAAAAMNSWDPAEAHRRPQVATPATPIPALPDPDAAQAWLDIERPCLVAAALYAAAHGWPTHAIQTSITLYRYLDAGHFTDGLAVHDHARRAAEQAGDVAGEAYALRSLGTTYTRLGCYQMAAGHHEQALARFRRAGDQTGEASALNNLGLVELRMGRYEQAAEHHRQALARFRQAGDQTGEASALNNLGLVEQRVGRYEQAIGHHGQALARFRQAGDQTGEASALHGLGDGEELLGRYESAAEHYRQALALVRQLHHSRGEVSILDSLGIVHLRLCQPERAAEHLAQGLTLCREIGEHAGEAYLLNGLGEAAQIAGRVSDGLSYHTDALAIAAETGTRDQQARAHAGLGEAYRTLGDRLRAHTQYERALAIYTNLDSPEANRVRADLTALAGPPATDDSADA